MSSSRPSPLRWPPGDAVSLSVGSLTTRSRWPEATISENPPVYDVARAALAEAYAEVCAESLRDSAAMADDERAAALPVWARLAADEDLIRWAIEIKRRAERKAAELQRDIARGDQQRKQRVPSRRQLDPESLAALRWLEELAERRSQRSA